MCTGIRIFHTSLELLAAVLINCINFITAQPQTIHLFQIIIGDGSTKLGYNLFGPAYEVAFYESTLKYRAIFDTDRVRVTRHYVRGENYSCEESWGLVVEGLSMLLPNSSENEFRIVLTPVTGVITPRHKRINQFPELLLENLHPTYRCTFEVLAIADFAREANVAVLSSVSGIPNQDREPIRFSNLLSLSGSPYPILAQAVTEMLKRHGWKTFNVLCDKVPDPLQIAALEIFCGMIQDITHKVGLSPVEHVFNSAEPNYRQLLQRTKTFSTVNVMVAFPSTCKEILTEAPIEMMNTGEYIFFALDLSPFELLQDLVSAVTFNDTYDRQVPFFATLPYVFQFNFDEINWDTVTSEIAAMNKLSKTSYNWTVVAKRERNINRLAAFEGFQVMAEVLNDSCSQLTNMSARQFVSIFHGRTFELPSRAIRVSNTGTRLCNINIKQSQLQNSSTYSHESIFVFANDDLSLHPVTYRSSIVWPGEVQFPPNFRPVCYLPSGARCRTCLQTDSIIIPAVACLVIISTVVTAVVRYKLGTTDIAWWIITEEQLRVQVPKT